MADRLTKEKRSALMSRVKQRHTKPEVALRSLLHRMGYRFRLHSPKLAGSPDIIFPGRKKVIFLHGCFWHGHTCKRGRSPSSNQPFWLKKIGINQTRDARVLSELQLSGWSSLVVWECELKTQEELKGRLAMFLEHLHS